MKRKIFIFAALLSAVSVIATSILITISAYNDFFASIKNEVHAQAAYIQVGMEMSGDDYLEYIPLQAGHRLTLISPEGLVLYDSESDPANMDNHLNRPEIQEALTGGTGETVRYSNTVRGKTYYYALRLADGSVLRLAGTTASMLSSYDEIFWIVAVIVAVVITLSAIIASFATRRMLRPINEINIDNPDNNQIYDEIAPLITRIKEQRVRIDGQLLELDRTRREFSAITDNMSEGFLVLDREGKILSYNRSALHLFSVGSKLAIGTSVLVLNRSVEFQSTVQAALNGEHLEKTLKIHGRKCQLFADPVKADGTVQGVVLLLMDATEKLERDKLRREFTSNVSHELKTPLTAISGYAELLANGFVNPKTIPVFSRQIYDESQRMIALINDLMYLSKLEEHAPPPKEPVELLHLSQLVAERLSVKAQSHGVRVSVSGREAEIQGIPSVLEEMIYNLLDNAIKYNKKGGSAVITVNKAPNAVSLTVSDTGAGIPKAEQERIFERFYRVDKSHSETIEGTGLGLAIVKHGAMLNDAEIMLDSNLSGSRFTLRFPLSRS